MRKSEKGISARKLEERGLAADIEEREKERPWCRGEEKGGRGLVVVIMQYRRE